MEKHGKGKDGRTKDGWKEGETGLDLRDNGTLETDKVVCWKKEQAVLDGMGLYASVVLLKGLEANNG